MNIFAIFQERVTAILAELVAAGRLPGDLDLTRFVVEPPRDPNHGDMAVNAAMVYAREAKATYPTPRLLAEDLARRLGEVEGVAAVKVAGPGFLNVRLGGAVHELILRAALIDPAGFARGSAPPPGVPVNIEYVSANPTGPMHVGHGRGAVFGDALANLLAFSGRQVTREYYVNDAGAQVDVLARSAFLRYREALGETVAVPEGLYPGDYLKPVGAALAARYGASLLDQEEREWLGPVRDFAIAAMLDLIRDDLAALSIRHEVFFSERSLIAGDGGDRVAAAIADLRAKGLVYEGRLPPPKGQAVEDWEDREQTLFRASAFGDDVDRALLKSDGSYTYFAADMAYHKTKVDRGSRELIDVVGADHGGWVKRIQAAVRALSADVTLDVKLCQLVKLMRDGEPVKMSKRSGDFVTLRDVVDEVGCDAVRFMMLFRKNDAPLEFDLAKVREQSKDNPVFYVQYAHARTRSALRQALTAFPDLDISPGALAGANLSRLEDDGELQLLKLVSQFPRVLEGASAAHEPHRLAFYLHDLASSFHSHWTRGKDQPQLRFVNEQSRETTCVRLAMVSAIGGVIATGLGILGVSAPDEMR